MAAELWPDAQIILFDAFEHSEFLFKESGRPYHLGVLSDVDNKEVKFYQNDVHPGGNSYYKERNDGVFPPDRFKVYKTRTINSIVRERGFPKPDLVKIDVQGAEKDILAGAVETFADAKHLIVEMQHQQYNLGAPMVGETRPSLNHWVGLVLLPSFAIMDPTAITILFATLLLRRCRNETKHVLHTFKFM